MINKLENSYAINAARYQLHSWILIGIIILPAYRNYLRQKKISALRFIHNRLLTGKMQFSLYYKCPHYNNSTSNITPYNHFLTNTLSQTTQSAPTLRPIIKHKISLIQDIIDVVVNKNLL